MAINKTHGMPRISDVPDNARKPENWALLISGYPDYQVCNHYSHTATHPRVIVLSAGGPDLLGTVNAEAITERATAWKSQDMEGDEASSAYDNVRNEWPITTHHGMYDYVGLCVDVEEIQRETLSSIVDTRIHFDDYPVLDEEEYSKRELKEFEECFNQESRYIKDEWNDEHVDYNAAIAYATEHYLGYSDPGYISPEHVKESWKAAKCARKRA